MGPTLLTYHTVWLLVSLGYGPLSHSKNSMAPTNTFSALPPGKFYSKFRNTCTIQNQFPLFTNKNRITYLLMRKTDIATLHRFLSRGWGKGDWDEKNYWKIEVYIRIYSWYLSTETTYILYFVVVSLDGFQSKLHLSFFYIFKLLRVFDFVIQVYGFKSKISLIQSRAFDLRPFSIERGKSNVSITINNSCPASFQTKCCSCLLVADSSKVLEEHVAGLTSQVAS